jgi:hypothetical protein
VGDARDEVALQLIRDPQRLHLHRQHPVEGLQPGEQIGPLQGDRRLRGEQPDHGGGTVGEPGKRPLPGDHEHAHRSAIADHRLPQGGHRAGRVHEALGHMWMAAHARSTSLTRQQSTAVCPA